MKKVLVVAAVLVGAGVLARLFGPKMSNIDWEKRFEAMPDNAPPKWMFRNITAIRENTDRILELLESGRSGWPSHFRRHLTTDAGAPARNWIWQLECGAAREGEGYMKVLTVYAHQTHGRFATACWNGSPMAFGTLGIPAR